MKEIAIKSGYTYLPEYNVIINNEFKKTFEKYSISKKALINKTAITTDIIRKNLKELSLVIFEITQSCNLRCKYSVFSGNYYHHRRHTKSVMSLETAKAGLDYIFSIIKNREKKEFSIGYYGGEPLLQYNLLKDIVKYSKKLFKNWDLNFSLTTNLTLLKKEMMKFLKSNDFKILVSLDGSKEHHDSKRVFSNGKGSFRKVMNNLRLIKNEDIHFFERNISFSTVYSHDLSIMDVYEFFVENNLINNNQIRFSSVDSMNTDYYKSYRPDLKRLKKDIMVIEEKIKEKKTNNEKLKPIENSFFDKLMNDNKLNFRNFSLLYGTCLFNSRTFIDAEGRFHLCERLNNTLSYGDVWSGFDYSKMKKIVDDYISITESNCSKCDYSFICRPCYVSFADNGTFILNNNACNERRSRLFGRLKNIVELGELSVSKNTLNNTEHKYKFHQFIVLEKGPVNTAIIDFLKGNVYQVENIIIEKFNNSHSEKDVNEFLESALKEELLIKTNKKTWIPNSLMNGSYLEWERIIANKRNVILELEEGVDLSLVKEEFRYVNVGEINMYSENKYDEILPSINITYKVKDFEQCKTRSCVDQDFDCNDINESFYVFNKHSHSCWRNKIAVSKKREVKPCIYSDFVLGTLGQTNLHEMLKKLENYWYLSKDKIEKCKDCELRYICFDCREIAYRKYGSLFAPNPNCKYNPYTGKWR